MLKRKTTIKDGSKAMRHLRESIRSTSSAAPGEPDSDKPIAFRVKLLGSVTIDGDINDGSVVDATKRVRAQQLDVIKAILVVTSQEVKVLNETTSDTIQTSDMAQVVFTSRNPEDKKIFCYATKSKYGILHCHIFQVKDKGHEIVRSISKAMNAARSSSNSSGADADAGDQGGSEFERGASIKSSASTQSSSIGGGGANDTSADIRAFDVFYLGYQAVPEARGADIVSKAIVHNEEDRKHKERTSGQKLAAAGDPVTLLITRQSLRTVERLSGETMMNDFIKHMSFSATDKDKSGGEIFAYIYFEERHNSKVCHIFSVPKGQGQIIRAAVKDMYQAGQKELRLRGNPFAALPDCPRDVPKGDLFKKQIHRSDLKPVHVIGAGQYGEVYLALQTARIKGGGKVDLKRAVKMVRNNATKEDKKEFQREAETMMLLEHENLVRLVGVAVQQAPWLAVLEFCEHGDLRSVVRAYQEKHLTLTTEEQVSFCEQLAGGMAYLTAQRLVHMDLAARNCLLAHCNVVKVADFGLTRKVDPGPNATLRLRERLKLPLKWVSIEGLDDKIFGEASDCWSFGVLMWEVLSYGATPYADIRTSEIQQRVRAGLRLQMPRNADPRFWTIITRCWVKDPRARYTFIRLQQVLQDLMQTLPSGPRRDIGIFLKSDGADDGLTRFPKLKSPKELLARPTASQTQSVTSPSTEGTAPGSSGGHQGRAPQTMSGAGTTSTSRPAGSGTPAEMKLPEPLGVLRELGLMMYKDIVVREKITSFMFQRCDDAMLNELGFHDPAHRKKILDFYAKILGAFKKAASLRRAAHEQRTLATQLQSDNASMRRQARVAAHIDTHSTPESAAHRRKLAREQHQAAMDKTRADKVAREAEEAAQREAAVAKYALEAERIAQEKAAKKKADQEARRAAEQRAAAAQASGPAPRLEERSRARKRQEEESLKRRGSVAKLHVSAETSRKLGEHKKSSQDLFGTKAPEWGEGKSKIWKALNPKPIAFESARERAERKENAVDLGLLGGDHTNYSYLNSMMNAETTAHATPADGDAPDDGPGDFDDLEDMVEEEEAQESEEEEEEADVSPDSLGDLDSDFMAMMAKNRAARAQEEEARKAKLKAAYDAKMAAEQAERDKELAIIRAEQALERAEKEKAKEEAVKEAQARMEEFVFDFKFG
eukprot:m.1085046 g.1085046  ORF g.1085046 m.1085046 type:complete len:1167 (-) comp24278_c1_seq1:375-3875(-)